MIFDNELKKRVALDCKDFDRYLGTLIDNHLSWKQHINQLVKLLDWSLNYDLLYLDTPLLHRI